MDELSLLDALDALEIEDCQWVIRVAKAEKRLAEAHSRRNVAIMWGEIIKLAEGKLTFVLSSDV